MKLPTKLIKKIKKPTKQSTFSKLSMPGVLEATGISVITNKALYPKTK